MPVHPYRLISLGRQIGIGVAGTMEITMAAMAKPNGSNAPYCVPNELICAELGRFLRLPIPPCGIVWHPHGAHPPLFASMDFNLTGNSLPPVDPQRCVAELPNESAGLLLFDILVGNCDRHRGNLAVDFSSNPPRMSVFDHSHALFGYEAGNGENRLKLLRDRLAISGGAQTHGNRHCFLDVISSDKEFSHWIGRVQGLPDYLIEELCMDTVDMGATAAEVAEAVSFLKHRRNNLARIIEAHRKEFRSINQWSLFL